MGQKVIEVQLKGTISRLLHVSFPFNLFNFILMTKKGEIIKLGIESYGETLGSELQRLRKEGVRECSFVRKEGVKCSLFVLENNKIQRVSYLVGDSELVS